jgi:sulfofructose kinase
VDAALYGNPTETDVNMRFDVVGLGLNATDIAIEVPTFPEFNSKVPFTAAHWQAGGQTATALVACQRLGLRAKYVGRVGSDPMGDFQLQSLRPEGIDLSDVKVIPECPNQTAYILVDQESGERTVLWHRDPRLIIHPEELRPEMIKQARLLHVDGHDNAAAAQAARWAREEGIPVTVDADNIYPDLDELLEAVDYLVGSSTFATAYTGEADVFRALDIIQQRYRHMKVVGATLGRDGVVALSEGRFAYRPAYVVPCRDTTGAGDVFHGAFAYALLQGWPLERILDFSNAMAGLNCGAVGARGGIARLEEVEQLMAEGRHYPPLWTELPSPSAPEPAR